MFGRAFKKLLSSPAALLFLGAAALGPVSPRLGGGGAGAGAVSVVVSAFTPPSAHRVASRYSRGDTTAPNRRRPAVDVSPLPSPDLDRHPNLKHSPSALSAASSDDIIPTLLDTSGPLGTALVVVFALVLLVAAQTFINSMLEGDRGLGAFLSDGRGYGKSGFKPRGTGQGGSSNGRGKGGRGTGARKNKGGGGGGGISMGGLLDGADAPLSGPDPLPWLKLPKLDFVDVAGQDATTATEMGGALSPEEEKQLLGRLELMAELLRVELGAGNVREAEAIRAELEGTMERYGISYDEGFQ